MALSNRDRVGRALDILASGLQPFVDANMPAVMPDGKDWLDVMRERDRRDGRPATMIRTDPRLLLRVIAEHQRAFRDSLSRTELAFAQEIREVGNKWAHNDAFSDADTMRALDTMVRLLRAAGAVPEADQVEKLWTEHQQAAFEKQTKRAVRQSEALPPVEGMGLKSWREVIEPHPDVATGRFNASQFAANLFRVAHEDELGEYGDPVEFFQRTYLTEGLRDLISRAVRRICGDDSAAPVVNLQTNFGGGKTHSMLALYHLFSGRPLSGYPQDMQELLDGQDLVMLGPGKVKRVTLVGNHLSPSQGVTEADGTHVNTLWGELAFQLGGRAAYDRIAGADLSATNPGAALTELIGAYAPCLILIDEWVAYARELYRGDLAAGSFDTQFTFAQTLTEAVSSVPGALLVVSVPASDIEVGGTHGQEALSRLLNVIRRMADQWRPASPQESFEIVRRRLFQDATGAARTDIAAVARRFTQFYSANRSEFPSHVAEPDYEKRIRECYPLHPELFDRLYQDWSTLERFQRTRGVLRLMSTAIYALWQAGDPYPLIMPATVPLSDRRVFDDLTQYLEDSWKSIIDTDVDGPESTPARIDHERSTFGQRALTRRLARTIFIGSAATLKSAHKGIDQRGIWLGTAVPGDTVAHFSSALHVLADQATYLYSDTARYWYDTQASIGRAAKDIAERLRDRPEEVQAEIVRRLQPFARRSRGDFAAVPIAPEGTGDILDTDEARLVVLHPRYPYRRNGEERSPALSFARDAVGARGSAQRRHRNQLVFLAPDARRLEELEEAVREYLAWKDITGRVKQLDLTPNQVDLATTRLGSANDVTEQRISTTYIWVIYPYQPDPSRPLELSVIKAESQSPELALRVSEKLNREGALASVHSSRNIHHYLAGPLKAVWERGYVSVGELWDLYTTYPYLPRLRDRSVLEAGLQDALNSITWEQDGFALATGRDDANGDFDGLAIPHRDSFGLITDAVLLVRPDIALHQRSAEGSPPTGTDADSAGTGSSTVKPNGEIADKDGPIPPPAAPRAKTRFFGVFRVDPQKYGRDLTRLQQEILPHLTDLDTGDLTITVEIEASRPDGFPDDKIRILTENARVLKFEQSDFE